MGSNPTAAIVTNPLKDLYIGALIDGATLERVSERVVWTNRISVYDYVARLIGVLEPYRLGL